MHALALLLRGLETHLTTVCTSTAPSNCNSSEIVFFFGSYHSMGEICPGGECSAPGTVEITKPDGTSITGSFVDVFPSSASRAGTCPAADMMANGPTNVVPSDAAITCYAANPPSPSAQQSTYALANTCDAFPHATNAYRQSTATFYARVVNASSGVYTVCDGRRSHLRAHCHSRLCKPAP